MTAVNVARTRYGDPESLNFWNERSAIRALLLGISFVENESLLAEREKLRKWITAGKEFRDCETCPLMAVVPPGMFTMGSLASEEGRDNDEGPLHQVMIVQSFTVGKYEVTRGQFEEFIKATEHVISGGCWIYSHSEDD